MDFNEYEMQVLTRLRLAELRAAALRHARLAPPPRPAGPGLRARVGRGLVRLGVLVEGRRGQRRLLARPPSRSSSCASVGSRW